MAKLFFLISGEFETLSYSELKAILETEQYPYKIVEKLDQTVRLEADKDCISQVQRRSGYTRIIAEELFTCEASNDAITQAASQTEFKKAIAEN